jgi:hypothetical protein
MFAIALCLEIRYIYFFRNMMEIGLAAASTLKKKMKKFKKEKKENCSIFGLMKKSVQLRHLYPPFNAV